MKFLRLSSLCLLSLLIMTSSCKKDDDDDMPVCEDIDGNVYKTVKIGTQVWMAENLRTTNLNNNEAIPDITDNSDWGELITPGFCYYDNDNTNKPVYGALYNHFAVNSGNLAPEGWHVPTEAEILVLINFLGGESAAGGKLKEEGTSRWQTPNTGATDDYGFAAVGGGHRHPTVGFYALNQNNFIWVSDKDGTSGICYKLDYENASFIKWATSVNQGFSVRCIKD